MLAVVDLTDKRKRLFERFRKHGIDIERLYIDGAEPVFLIRAHREYTDFSRLRPVIESCGKAVFLNNEMPDELADLQFQPYALPLKMMVKSAADHFKKQPKSSCRVTLSVIDEFAQACKEVSLAVRYVRCVRVITSKGGRYEQTAQNLFNQCGASLMISDDLNTANGSDYIISYDDRYLNDIEFKYGMVYKSNLRLRNVVQMCGSEVITDFHCDAVGESDKFQFLCALYEECGYKADPIPSFYPAHIFNT